MKPFILRISFTVAVIAGALGCVTTSCSTAEAALEIANFKQLATSADSTAAVSAGVQPAPSTMSTGEARRYYRAQLAAVKAGQARKTKNSNNTTVEQKITTVDHTTQAIALGLAFTLGLVVGGALVLKFGRKT